MKPLLFSVLFLLSFGFLIAQDNLSDETKSFVIHEKGYYVLQNLTIIDGTGDSVMYNQDVIINGDKIESVGANLEVPSGAFAINMEGKSAIPGLVMLHEHLFYPKTTPDKKYGVDQMTYSFPKLYLAGGVTTMRTAGSIMPQADVNIKKAILRGLLPGPKMDVTSPHLDREGTGLVELGPFDSTEQAVKMVNFWP